MKTKSIFKKLEKEGIVELIRERDYDYSIENLEGDTYKPELHPEIPEETILKEKKAFQQKVEEEGVWIVIVKVGNWQDSIGGFVGNEWEGSGYDEDMMEAAILQAKQMARKTLLITKETKSKI